jgi:hypothetical protein
VVIEFLKFQKIRAAPNPVGYNLQWLDPKMRPRDAAFRLPGWARADN